MAKGLEQQLSEVDDLAARGVISNSEASIRRQSILASSDWDSGSGSGGVTVLVLGIIGAIFGVILGLVAMAVGGTANALEEGAGNEVVGLGVSAIFAATVGVIAAGTYFAGAKRTLMAWVLLIAAVWHLVSISYFAIPGFIFLLLAAIFAWFGRKR